MTALARLGAAPAASWIENRRHYARLAAAGGELLARWSEDPRDVERYRQDAVVRGLVGGALPLRTPPVTASGPGWLVEPWIDTVPMASCDQVFRAALDAVAVCVSLDLPTASVPGGGGAASRVWQRSRLLVSPIPLRHLRAARRLARDPGLPLAGSHGDLHQGNMLLARDGIWVIDWELAGPRPFGYDAATLAASTADADLIEAAAAWITQVLGNDHRIAARRLVYATAVRVAGAKLAPVVRSDGDAAGARRLAAMLDGLAARARVS